MRVTFFDWSGTDVEMPPVTLRIPRSALKIQSAMLLRYYKHGYPTGIRSHRDVYSVHPLLFRFNDDMQVRFIWDETVREKEPDSSEGLYPHPESIWSQDSTEDLIMCPKVSWTEDHKKKSCYSIAGIDIQSLEPCWKDKDGVWMRPPMRKDGIDPEDYGCASISPKKVKPGTIVRFEFLSDRFANFSILPLTDEERSRSGRDWRIPGSRFVGPEGVCWAVPESNRWAVRIDERGEVRRRLMCRNDADCHEGPWTGMWEYGVLSFVVYGRFEHSDYVSRCEFLEGCESGIGLCRRMPAGE
ncbi:MAG: hypothetical protein JXR96_08415 [Deltaproteobacteria bacterium]|nr:hypothetical protein [Deltaproteobacteria bacterium]